MGSPIAYCGAVHLFNSAKLQVFQIKFQLSPINYVLTIFYSETTVRQVDYISKKHKKATEQPADDKQQNINFALILILGILTFSSYSCRTSEVAFEEGQRAKNIIFLIGDGMGVPQISAALYSNNNRLALEAFPYVGFHKTYSESDLITDSAAGATAFACGIKTYNGAIGMDQDTLPCYSLLEELQDNGYATGLIATSTIVHATPAAFAAHQPLRWQYEEIAVDLSQAGVDFMVGGGRRYFNRRDKDERDLLQEMAKEGYLIRSYLDDDLPNIMTGSAERFFYLSADKHPLTRAAGRAYLPYSVQLGASFLSRKSDSGFFLVAEGSQIDWGGHSNEGQLIVEEVLDFDRAVEAALDYARRDGETLVVVTTDHETGGMAIMPGSKMGDIKASFNHNGHTAAMVPVFAYGPSSERFEGIYDNTEIYFKMRAALGMEAPNTTAER